MRKWFAAKTVYRSQLEGEAVAADGDALEELPAGRHADVLNKHADARAAALVEERVVLFLADTADEAIDRAEEEARAYASAAAFNVVGQRIATRVLGYVETYELGSAPSDGAEVFSRTFLAKRSVADGPLLDCVAPLDDLAAELRSVFEPNVSQTVRRRLQEK